MKTTVKNLSATKVELTIKLQKDELLAAKDAAVKILAPSVNLPGFRKGKAPLELAEKHIDPNHLIDETLNAAVQATVIKALNEEKIQALNLPEVNVKKFVPDQELEYTATTEIWPEVKLCDYKKLKAKPTELKTNEKDIEDVVKRIAENYRETKKTTGKAKSGQEVVIDFLGKMDGKVFEGGKAEKYPLTLGSGSFIPGFEDGIIGHEAGEEFELKLAFPKDYHAKNLAGKAVVFEIKLREVREVVLPEINDEFASKYTPFKTLKELKADIKQNLTAQNERSVKEQLKDALTLEIIEKSEIPVPETIVKEHFEFAKSQEEALARQNGIKLADYIKLGGDDEKSWKKKLMEVATKRAQAVIAMQEIAKQEKITVSDTEFEEKFAELKKTYGNSKQALKDLEKPRVKEDIRNRLKIDATYDFLIAANAGKTKTAKKP